MNEDTGPSAWARYRGQSTECASHLLEFPALQKPDSDVPLKSCSVLHALRPDTQSDEVCMQCQQIAACVHELCTLQTWKHCSSVDLGFSNDSCSRDNARPSICCAHCTDTAWESTVVFKRGTLHLHRAAPDVVDPAALLIVARGWWMLWHLPSAMAEAVSYLMMADLQQFRHQWDASLLRGRRYWSINQTDTS